LFVIAQCLSPVASFVALAGTAPSCNSALAASTSENAVKSPEQEKSTADDPTKPSYEIEPIQIRIGHGFDIHRMAPLQEAGQPVVIGGVEIPHKDQKVRRVYIF
jgi:hypothetical protein